MPSLSNITATFFIDLINRLGIRPPPPEAFLLSNVVQPVSIIDSGVVLQSIATTQLLDGAFSQGVQATPGAGTILADTGALPQGNYLFFVMFGMASSVNGWDFLFGRRNAANAAYVWSQIGASIPNGVGFGTISFQARLLLNERLRVEEFTAPGGACQNQVNIFAQLLQAG